MKARAAMLLALMLLTATAWADDVNYIDANGDPQSHDATTLAGSDTGWTGWYVASDEVEISDRVVVTGEAHLILSDGAMLAIPKGITVTEGNSLTIYGQNGSTGKLTIASPESGYAGIGGYVTNTSTQTAANTGSITINGGTIDVTGSSVSPGYGGAAIGGAYWGYTGTITINGGSVTATGKRYGAGIGSGVEGTGGTITITGGMVVATSAGGAGIGGAVSAVTPDIYISGGNVTASTAATATATGIGAGGSQSANIITISGGTVTAIGNKGSAGIGGTAAAPGTSPGNCGTVTISGGTITAIGGEGGAGIGGGRAYGPGYPGANGGTIIITGGNITARTTYNATYGGGYGIGHGYAGNSTGLTADIRLSWTAASNSITAEGYTGAVTIIDGKAMTDGTNAYSGALTSDEITAIAGKTLRPCFALADNASNTDFITDNVDNTVSIALLGRTFYTDGDWNTLCLPFDVDDLSSTSLNGFTVKELDTEIENSGHKTGFENGTLYLNFKDVTSIDAGKPYIVKKDVEADFIISSEDNWETFALNVSNGTTYEGQIVSLGDDISVSTMVSGIFRGTFDGNGHTIDVNLNGGGEGLALFYFIEDATIQNVGITGTVSSRSNRPATFSSFARGNSTIKNCRSSVNIVSTKSGWVDGGAFVAQVYAGASFNMTDCLFSGSITYNGGTTGGGMVGYAQSSTSAANGQPDAAVNLKNCFFNPLSLTLDVNVDNPCIFVSGDVRGNLTNCYYNAVAKASVLENEGIDGSSMSAAELASALGTNWVASGNNVLPDCTPGIKNPVFGGVTIQSASPTPVTSSDDAVSFVGSYSPVIISGENKTMLFLGSGNTLYYPNAAMTIGSCRAYFQLNNGLVCGEPSQGGDGINAFVLNFGEETGLTPIPSPKGEGSDLWYAIDGRKLSGKPAQKGIFINNGKKVVIK